jgi:putative ATP-dependent endonuclease of OLD family
LQKGTEVLRIRLEVTVDPSDPESLVVARTFPDSGHLRPPTRVQLDALGWGFVSATLSLVHELSGTQGAIGTLLSQVDLGKDRKSIEDAVEKIQEALHASKALKSFRASLAGALTDALPFAVVTDDLRVTTQSGLVEDPLESVSVAWKRHGHMAALGEQSDGVRALSSIAIGSLALDGRGIVAVDEPERHLHPSAQRAIGSLLQVGPQQRIISTHSPDLLAQVQPEHIVAMRANEHPRQLSKNSSAIQDAKFLMRWWHPSLLEPITAGRVVIVEGPSDRILVEAVAEHLGFQFHRPSISLFELSGADQAKHAVSVFGANGFGLDLYGLVDEDARERWGGYLEIEPEELEDNGYQVCDPDLEGVYIDALGVNRIVELLVASPDISERKLLGGCAVTDVADINEDALCKMCRKNKVSAAIAIAQGLTKKEALSLEPLCALIQALQ